MTGNSCKHLFIIHRYFWPQNYPYAIMLKDISEAVARNFDRVTIVSTEQEIGELDARKAWANARNIQLKTLQMQSERKKSLFMKLLNMAKYSLWVFFQLLVSRPSVVMVATTPPVLTAAIVRWMSYVKGYRYIYHCQDIHPEAMLYNRTIKPGLMYGIIRSIDKKNIDHAFRVITLSDDMRRTMKARGSNIGHVHLVNNFIFQKSQEIDEGGDSSRKFLFAGNLGRLQNLEILFQALVQLKDLDGASFDFMGSGILEEKLRNFVAENKLGNVHFLGQKPVAEAVEVMSRSNFGIVSLSKGITHVAYPSKTMIYLGNGLPLLALIEEDTELGRFINDNHLGIAVEPTSPEKIVRAIETLVSTSDDPDFARQRIVRIANRYFGKEVILDKFSMVINE